MKEGRKPEYLEKTPGDELHIHVPNSCEWYSSFHDPAVFGRAKSLLCTTPGITGLMPGLAGPGEIATSICSLYLSVAPHKAVRADTL